MGFKDFSGIPILSLGGLYGIIFDVRELLEDVKKIVDEEKSNTPGWEKLLFENIERR